MAASEKEALIAFQCLSPNTWLLEPSVPAYSNSPAHEGGTPLPPSTIALLSWMNASPRHIARYIKGYTILYPTARILLITSNNNDFQFRSDAKQQQRIAPAIEVISGDTEKRLLLHLFSNGGAQQVCQLAQLYRSTTGGKLLPAQAMVLDSGPGMSRIKQGVAAMTVGLKNRWVRMMGVLLTYIILTLMVLFTRIRGTDVISRIRESLNDTSLMEVRAPRCYIYSEADAMVAWKDVANHVDDAVRRGWKVSSERYIDSGHVSHMRQDPERYWAAVQTLWATGAS